VEGFDKDRLKTLRLKVGLSQNDLAEKSGVNVDNIQNAEQGRRVPRVEILLKLARALGVTVDELLGDQPPRRRKKGGTK
jgi:XRE family transcriptional regulator, fatty acid utilization regulator